MPPDQGPSLFVYHAVFALGAEGTAKDNSAAVTRDKLPHARKCSPPPTRSQVLAFEQQAEFTF